MNVRSIKPARWWALETMSAMCTEEDKWLDTMTPQVTGMCIFYQK